MTILDASVILKWFVDEDDSPAALRFREELYNGERQIVVPDLLLYEVANALRYNRTFSSEEIGEAVGSLFGMNMEIVAPTTSLLAKASKMALELELTCYDAVYLALADELGFEFVTADEKLCRMTRTTRGTTAVRLLREFWAA